MKKECDFCSGKVEKQFSGALTRIGGRKLARERLQGNPLGKAQAGRYILDSLEMEGATLQSTHVEVEEAKRPISEAHTLSNPKYFVQSFPRTCSFYYVE